MDETTVFIKTAEGEAAVKDRARLEQRDLRKVLILVDGHTPVSELRHKMGDGEGLDEAFDELLRLGMIDQAPVPIPEPSSPVVAEGAAAMADADFLLLDAGDGTAGAAATVRVLPGFVTPIVKAPPRASLLSRLFKRVPRAAKPQPVRTGKLPATSALGAAGKARRRLKLAAPILAIGTAVVLLLVALLGVLYLVHGRDHRSQFEAVMAGLIGQPVRIHQAGMGFAPWPVVALEDVRIGEHATIRRIDVSVSLGSLFSSQKRLHHVRLTGLKLDAAALPAAAGWLAGARRDDVRIDGLDVEGAALVFGGRELGGYVGTAQLSGHGVLTRLTLRDAEGKQYIELTPQADGFAISAALTGWKLPGRDALLFPVMKLDGALAADGWRLTHIEGTLFDGRVDGSGNVLRHEAGVRFEGSFKLVRTEIEGLLQALGGGPGVAGPANGTLQFVAQGPSLTNLLASFRAEGPVRVQGGALRHLDLVQALRQRGQPVEGGASRFENLQAVLTVSEKSAVLSDVHIESGLLRASGTLTRTREALVGNFAVVLGDGVSGQVAIGGTAQRPVLKAVGGR